ncbi:amino acid aminotransferase [Pseudomonas sp. MS15a(2019)]|uniref:amino acid aminotransferase n=1 Tax=Pseudomonas sp. MS15a(2019) TaxID=2579938 RepID=UPI001563B90B|nr:amino acid aminotransferase [Pseudomonas sp. MS15a(2019)]NRH41544.1 aspartate/tyrosine/aromatic aminotransferase [Pseudomonas sp. MS15a(2019)]
MFEHLAEYPGDPILSLIKTYQDDTRPEKVNLGVGVYLDAQGRLPVLQAVAAAEQQLRKAAPAPSMYLPMAGHDAYRLNAQRLQFGDQSQALAEGRIATIQTLGGSGALRTGADFLRQWFPDSGVWVSDPTWDNHLALFAGAGFTVGTYPYCRPASAELAFEAMLGTLSTLPRHGIVLLHPCCHNPTGLDLTNAQWLAVIQVLAERELIAFVDCAYQGFGEGLEADVFAIREMERAGLSFLVSYSFSKNFSLYGERVGTLSVVCSSAPLASKALGQLQATVRRHYSSPPRHGALLVDLVLGSELADLWRTEVDAMRTRIAAMRESLAQALVEAGLPLGERIRRHRGLFSYTHLTRAQVLRLRQDHGIYLVDNGRLCLAGLTEEKLAYVSAAIADVIR